MLGLLSQAEGDAKVFEQEFFPGLTFLEIDTSHIPTDVVETCTWTVGDSTFTTRSDGRNKYTWVDSMGWVKDTIVTTGLTIDPGPERHPYCPTPYLAPLRIAIDSSGRIFHLLNFRRNEFNDLVDNHPPTLNHADVYEYGRFVVKTTQIYTWLPGHSCFVSSTKNLKQINRDEVRYYATNPWLEDWGLKSQHIDRRIDSLASELNQERLTYDQESKEYLARYYVWYVETGVLRKITLRILPNGHCYPVVNRILAEKIGYYDPYGTGLDDKFRPFGE